MMRRAFTMLAIVALATVASAQTMPPAVGFSDTGQPTRYAMQGVDYAVRGYRSATWGMTPDQVRAAIRRDFPAAPIAADQRDPVLETTIVVASVPALAPGPGPAFVGYVFGAKTGRLIQVNLDWQVAAPTPAQRDALAAAGAAIVADFVGHYWKIGSVTRGAAIGPRTLILFAGSGEAGGAVDVRLEGVPYTLRTPAPQPWQPAADGPALLHVSFARTADQPDITTIKSGDF
jgi:hypothetical protein